jgi:hypothetical protein
MRSRRSLSADRISHAAIVVAGLLCGALVFVVAVPLASSSPYPAPRESAWVINRSSPGVAAPVGRVPLDDDDALAEWEAITAWSFAALPPSGMPSRFEPDPPEEPAMTGSITQQAVRPAPATPTALAKRSRAGIEEVDTYLWEVYQRAPVKRDSTGDFTWKDPTAAKRFGLSMPAYVIGGMDPDFKEQLYHAGHAMDAAGIRWSILSAFRDDYRQSLASGLKAGTSNSLHGGKARTGGYGHGQAVDVTSEDGHAEAVWRWLDKHGGKYGLYRPMPGADPAHVQSKGNWHKLAATLRESRVRTVQEARAAAVAATAD